MINRLKGLSRAEIFRDYQNRRRATVNPMQPSDAVDYHDAFIEEAAFNPLNSETYRQELKAKGLASINNYEADFRDETLRILEERGKNRLSKHVQDAEESVKSRMAGEAINRYDEQYNVDSNDMVSFDDLMHRALEGELADIDLERENARQLADLKEYDKQRYGGQVPFKASVYTDPAEGTLLAEQKRNRALLFEGKLPRRSTLEFDSIKGSDLKPNSYIGIAGEIAPDSEARIFMKDSKQTDPLMDERGGKKDVSSKLVPEGDITEYMSPTGYEDLYKKWVSSVEAENASGANAFTITPYRDTFDNFVSEYYGQQALALAGKTSVLDSSRSYQTKDAAKAGHKSATVGTNRLLEMTNSILNPEVELAADLRWNENGKVVVADNQARDIIPGEENTLRLNFAKASQMPNNGLKNIRNSLVRAIAELQQSHPTGTLDDAYRLLVNRGQAPSIIRGTPRNGESGLRAGKLTSSGAFMGAKNNGEQGRQYRMNKILFTLNDATRESGIGSIPIDYQILDTAKTRRAMFTDPSLIGSMHPTREKGKIDIEASISDLNKAKVLQALLNNRQLSQITQHYSM